MNSVLILGRFYLKSLANSLIRARIGGLLKLAIPVCLALVFWMGSLYLLNRALVYILGVEVIGGVMAVKLLEIVCLAFFSLLIYSNIIVSLNTFLLSRDTDLLLSLPISIEGLSHFKLFDTAINSSWMLLLFGGPVFLTYGIVYNAPLLYYLYLPLLLLPFILIAAILGSLITLLLTNLFSAQGTRNTLIVITIITFVILFCLFRFMRPERIVDPSGFQDLLAYLNELRSPSSPFLPSTWLSKATLSLAKGNTGQAVLPATLLLLTASSLTFLFGWVSIPLYPRGYSLSQGSKKRSLKGKSFIEGLLQRLGLLFPQHMRPLLTKEIKIFFRDTSQWSQIFLLFALIVIYLYNFKVLPLHSFGLAKSTIANLLSLINIALAGFVISALSARFVYPSLSIEGRAFWVILSSPLTGRDILFSKLAVNLLPLLLFSLFIISTSNYILEVPFLMKAISTVTITFLTFGLTSLGIGLGALFPNFKAENTAKVAVGFGGFIFMILSMIYVGVIILIEAWPVFILTRFPHHPFPWGIMVPSLILFVSVNGLAILVPIKMALKRMEVLELNI